MAGIRRAFLVEQENVKDKKVIDDLLKDDAQLLKEFVNEHADPSILLNLKNLRIMYQGQKKHTRILYYVSEKELPQHNLYDHVFLKPLLNYCGTIYQEKDHDTSSYSIEHKRINLLVFVFVTGKEDECIEHGRKMLKQIRLLMPKLKFRGILDRHLSVKTLIKLFQQPVEELVANPDIENIMYQAVNIVSNVLEVGIFAEKVLQTFNAKKKNIVLAYLLIYDSDAFESEQDPKIYYKKLLEE